MDSLQILYITYVDFEKASSGSAVRPGKMYRAFLEEGHEVKLLTGSQDRKHREQRRAAVEEVSAWLDGNRPDLCYIESPVQPILWAFDRKLIRKIHNKGIPIGYFYRDFYWMFPDLYPRRENLSGRVKDSYLLLLQRITDRLLKKADIVYFPSATAAAYFSFRDMRPLPPAGEIKPVSEVREENTCIYVGGISIDYGGAELLRAFQLLNGQGKQYRLILCCREKERKDLPEELVSAPWLEIHHTSGEGLEPLYARASLAAFPVQKNAYTDISVNIKLFEYISHGLPVASTDVNAVAELVEAYGVGRVSGDSPEEMADNIRHMLQDREQLRIWSENAETCIREHGLWIHRVRTVVSDLRGKKK